MYITAKDSLLNYLYGKMYALMYNDHCRVQRNYYKLFPSLIHFSIQTTS